MPDSGNGKSSQSKMRYIYPITSVDGTIDSSNNSQDVSDNKNNGD